MKTQQEMFNYLKENLISHKVTVKDNKIIAKRKYKIGDSFSSFRITYLKNDGVSIKGTSYPCRTMRYDNDEDLLCLIGSMGSTKDRR